MIRVLSCALGEHNLWLLSLAILLCLAAFGGVAFVHSHLRDAQPSRRAAWGVALGFVAGGGAWATHFVGMLAFDPGMPFAFNLGWTIGSALLAAVGGWAGFAVLERFGARAGGAVGAGLIFAAGVAGLHYGGMAGLELAARPSWDADLLFASFLLCAAFAIAGMGMMARAGVRWARVAGAGLLALGVLSLHVTGMGAVTFTPDASLAVERNALHPGDLAVLVATVALAGLVSVVLLALADRNVTAAKSEGLERLRRLGDAALEGLFVHQNGRVIDANGRFCLMVGVSPFEISGREVSTLMDAAALEALQRSIDLPDDGPQEASVFGEEGAVGCEFLTRELTPGVFVTAARDLTQRRRAEEAEAANQAKSNFMATMSHELRTPLTTILAYAEVMRENAEEEERGGDVEDADSIIKASKHLLTLISEILDFARLEAGGASLEVREFPLHGFFAELALATKPLMDAQDNHAEYHIDPALGAMHSDPVKLRQCVYNLISNAAKFTRGGRVAVEAESEVRHGASGLLVTVRDTGIGMTPETLSRAFSPFTQADESLTRKFGGTGLGLSITRELLALMDGEISAESEVGQGTTMRLWAPLDARNATQGMSAARRRAPFKVQGVAA